MSLALQTVLFIACVAFIILVPVLIVGLYRLHGVTTRLLHAVEDFREECRPLVHSMSGLAERLHVLSIAAQDQWHEVEKIVQIAREWSIRLDQLVEEVGSTVGPPLHAVTQRWGLLRAGVRTFVNTFLTGDKHPESQPEETYERK